MAEEVTAVAHTAANGGTAAALTNANDISWREELNEVGSGQLVIQRDNTALADLAYGRVVRCRTAGTDRFAWRVEAKNHHTITAGEEAEEVVDVSGRGLAAMLEEVVVYPELGVGRISPDYRLFNFASTYYDDTAWVAATEIKKQDAVSAQWPFSPEGWPDIDAYWIWAQAQGGGTPPQPIGDCYFRTTFSLASQQSLRAYISADDGFELFFDGNRVTGETLAFLWGVTKYADLGVVDSGTHTVAIKGTNILRDSAATNIAGVICSIIEMEDGGQTPGTVRCRTDSTWKALAYPADPPGMTPGEIATILFDEAQDALRDALTGVTLSATESVDTDAVTWDTVDVGFPVGTSYLDVFRALAELGVDFAFSPTGLTFNLWQGRGDDLSGSVVLQRAVNLAELAHDGRGATFNVGLARYGTGRWYEQQDVTSVGAWGRKEGMLQIGTAPSDGAADRVITAAFDTRAQPTNHTVGRVEGVAPYVAFEVGDTLSVPDETLTARDMRVYAVAVTADDTGWAQYEVEF